MVLINNTITMNSGQNGGGIALHSNSVVTITNTILWNDDSEGMGEEVRMGSSSTLTIGYSDVEWGQDSMHVEKGSTLSWGEGMIDVDPLFRDPSSEDFHLMAIACGDSLDSPCIDAGDPAIDDSLLDCSWGLGTIRSDMGAYSSSEPAVGIGDRKREPVIPRNLSLSQNCPNPFNPSTSISFEIPGTSSATQSVSLVVYDIRGRLVKTLIDSDLFPGTHKIHWNGRNNHGQSVASGIYLYTLKAGGERFTRKMAVIK